jgi:hypothetical protein
MEKERLQELLDSFVVNNETNIENVAVENPLLYDAVINTLSFLSSKFGTSKEIKKLTEEEIEAKRPKKELPFKVGDVYYSDTFKQNLTITDVKADGGISVHYDDGTNESYTEAYCNLMVNKKGWVKVTAPTSTKATAKGTRVSPSQHASQTAVGTVMTGKDGNEWVVVEDSRGVRKWQRNTAKATTKVVSDEEQELLDAIEGTKLLADTGDSDAKKELSLLKAQLKKLKAK